MVHALSRELPVVLLARAQVAGCDVIRTANLANAELLERAERLQPAQELAVAGRGRRERLRSEQPTDPVQSGGDVNI